MAILIFSLIAIFCFLFILNKHLQGTLKPMIEFVLVILIIVSVVISFFVSKWWFGLIAIFSIFFLTAIFWPITQALASKLLGYKPYKDDQLSKSVDHFFRTIKESGDYNEAMLMINNENTKNKKQLLKIFNKPEIRFILYENNMTFDDFYDLFLNLKYGHNSIDWRILSSPFDLKKLIELKKKNASDDEIFNHFRNFSN